MSATVLTVYGTNQTSGVLATGNQLITAAGSPSTTTTTTLVGTQTGWGEVASQGSTSPWPGYQSTHGGSGLGLFLDSTVLDNQQILAGIWSANLTLSVSVGHLLADIQLRAFIAQSGGGFEPIGTFVTHGATITTSATTFQVTGTSVPMLFGPGDKLYLDLWLDIANNATSSSGATVALTLANSSSAGSAALCSIATPGYQGLTQTQALAAYSYGGFTFHDGAAYFLQEKIFAMPEIKQQVYKIARLDGMKKTGETVDDRVFAIKLRVVGTSRNDLELKLDALYQALYQRQQALTLHAADTRYWIADCVSASAQLAPGKVLTCEVVLSFRCLSPFAISTAVQNFSTGSVTLSLVSGTTWQTNQYSFAGSGSVYSRPTITLTNTSTQTITSVTLTQSTDSMAVTVGSISLVQNDYLTLVCDPSVTNGFTVTKNGANTPLAFTGIFPVQEPTLTNWRVQVNASSTAPSIQVQWSWTPRYLM